MSTYTVTTTSDIGDDNTVAGDLAAETVDGGGLSLREAVLLANAKVGVDSVEFDISLVAQTITLSGTELEITDAILIDGDIDNDGTADITVDGDGASRVFNATGLSAETTLRGLVVTGGYTSGSSNTGGGIYSRANLTVEDSIITGNATAGGSARGGGIYGFAAVTLTNSTISNNSTSGAGAAGGGLNGRGAITATDSTISGNATLGNLARGGGVYGISTITMTNSAVTDNGTIGTGAAGGGIRGLAAITLTNTTVSGNTTTGSYASGGGVFGSNTVTLTNSTVSGNSVALATSKGGGVYSLGEGGGGIALQNSVILGNADASGRSELYQGTGAGASITYAGGNIVGTDVFDGSTDIGDTTATIVFGAVVDNNGVDAGVLANNSGPVHTIALKDDAANPALDASDGSGATHDARGADAQNVVGVGVETGAGIRDIGAFEAFANEIPSLVVTTTGDVVDMLDNETSLREAIAHANVTAGTDTITFDASLSGQTITLSGSELEITDAVTIDGDIDDNGTADITLDGDGASRVINVSDSGADTTLRGLVLTGGRAGGDGGGVYGAADLAIIDSTVSGNSVYGHSSVGGGIAGNAAITLTNTTISGNSTAGDYGRGGGIYGLGAVTVTNSTVSGNSTTGGAAVGGGIASIAAITLTNTTISGNNTTGFLAHGGGIFSVGTITLTNSIVLGNVSTNSTDDEVAAGNITRVGGNIIGKDGAPGADVFDGESIVGNTMAAQVFSQTVDNNGVEAGVLADNGGPVQTIVLKRDAANPALDASDASGTASDARGEVALNIPGIGAESGVQIRDLGAFETLFAPVDAIDDGFAVDEDSSISGNLMNDNGGGADIDPASLGLAITHVNGSAVAVGVEITLISGALLTVNANGTFTYDPNGQFEALGPGQSETDDVTYTVADSEESSDTATVTINIIGRNETLVGTSGDDSLVGFNSSDDLLIGKGGHDALNGKTGGDTLRGEAGADTLLGGKGNDHLIGGGGNDTLFGEAGRDTLSGGGADDSLVGGGGQDKLNGGDGRDVLDGGGGNDILLGEAGGDTLSGQNGNDQLSGAGGGDSLDGSGGKDTLLGGGGDDDLLGGGGNDSLKGDVGSDTLIGGGGKDTLSGNGGKDVFVFTSSTESSRGAAKRDEITDFKPNSDMIDLSAIDAKTGGRDQAFSFIGQAAFSGTKGELRFEKTGGYTFVQGDTNGDGVADLEIELAGNKSLDSGDFAL